MNTSEVLNKAADVLEKRGWTQGVWNLHHANAPMCLEGGIAAALGVSYYSEIYDDCPAYCAVQDYLGIDRTDSIRTELWRWNDSAGRTQEQVIETLRATALIEAAKENPDAAKESAAAQVPAEVVA